MIMRSMFRDQAVALITETSRCRHGGQGQAQAGAGARIPAAMASLIRFLA